MKVFTYIVALFTLAACVQQVDRTSFVEPLVGSGGHGHVFVGANVPHGMVSVGPNNLSEGWDWCSGYHDSDRTIAGFAQNHLSGTGIADLGEIIVMPCLGEVPMTKGTGAGDGWAQPLVKETETVSPGYYAVELSEGSLKAEFTATDRVAYHRYSKNLSGGADHLSLLFDLASAPKSLMARQGYISSDYQPIDDYTIVGSRTSDEWARGQKTYFAAKFSAPVLSVSGDSAVFALDFGTVPELEVRIGLSYSSTEAAASNLENEGKLSFDDALHQAQIRWNSALSSISFEGISAETDTLFYTALYHTAFAPQLFSDSGQPDRYTIFSTWDTYRAAHPLYTIIDKEAGNYALSMLETAECSGRLPVWHLAGIETDCMVGVHSVPVIADAALKGLGGICPERALEQLRKLDIQPVEGMEYIDTEGYLPADKVNWSVSRALEYCIDDAAVADLAAACGSDSLAARYSARSGLWRNYFDEKTGYMRGKLSDGTFREPFNPSFSLHMEADYVEGNAWQYTWLVPHDVEGLISAFGGDEPFLTQLDALFSADSSLNEGASIDITGMIGQYAHGNEPSHHIAYLYAFAGRQYKTAEKLRQICRDFYTTAPDGLIGNEDCGQMSAWYVFTALGFYPVNPTGRLYVFGSPLCKEAVIRTAAGREFRIKAEGNSAENIYIQSVTLDGKDYPYAWISHEDIMAGGELVFTMGPQPSDFGIAEPVRAKDKITTNRYNNEY